MNRVNVPSLLTEKFHFVIINLIAETVSLLAFPPFYLREYRVWGRDNLITSRLINCLWTWVPFNLSPPKSSHQPPV